MPLAPEISTFGDGSPSIGDSGIVLAGAGLGAFPGEVWIFAGAGRTGAADQCSVVAWNDLEVAVDIPSTTNNVAGPAYVVLMREDLAWSNELAFTLVEAKTPLEQVLVAPELRPVYIGYFDILNYPIYGWTGPGLLAPAGTGDSDLDGNVFDSAAGAVQISDFVDNMAIGSSLTLTFAIGEDYGGFLLGISQLGLDGLGDPQDPVWDRLVIDRRAFMGRRAVVWLGFLNADERAVDSQIQRQFTGVMVGATTSRQAGGPTTITLELDQDLQKARGAPLRWIDHQVFFPTDTWSSFIPSLARGGTASAERPSHQPPPPGSPRWLPREER